MPSSISASRRLARFVVAVAAGLALGLGGYVLMAVALVTPQSELLQSTIDMERFKLRRLEDPARPPHLVVVAGSNALYSIDSAVLAQQVGRPVTNVAMQWNFAFLAMEAVAERTKPGDWVMLPLEWVFWDSLTVRSPIEACLVIAHHRARLDSAGAWLSAVTDCNPKMMLMAARQRLMRAVGFSFPNPDMKDLLSPEGDLTDNDPAKATFKQMIKPKPAPSAGGALPDWSLEAPVRQALAEVKAAAAPSGERYERLSSVVRAIRARGGRVFITFPVSAQRIDGYDVPGPVPAWADEHWLKSVQAWAAGVGAEVVSTPEAHAYPADCLFDSPYHLHRGCTAENSRRYAGALVRATASP